MNILVLEFLSGGGRSSLIDPSLISEGETMRDALVADLLDSRTDTVTVMLDAGLTPPRALSNARTVFVPIAGENHFWSEWNYQLTRCDAAWPIAPESGKTLERLCADVESSAAFLLTSSAQAVRLTSSKRQTCERLNRAGVSAVMTTPMHDCPAPQSYPVVVKPDDGAGCSGARVIFGRDEWDDWIAHNDVSHDVVQPYLEGPAYSLSALFARGEAFTLSLNRQRLLLRDGAFVLQSCSVNVPDHPRHQASLLGSKVAAAIPELWGYAGVDFVQTRQGPVILEVNPRLTSSYVGLRSALDLNVAALVLDLHSDGTLPTMALPLGREITVSVAHPNGN